MSREVRVYKVGDRDAGDDFDLVEIQLLIHQIAAWFSSPESGRNCPDPMKEAERKVQECLLGQTQDGKVWKGCPERFEDRIRVKCGWDMEAGQGIPSTRFKSPRAKKKLEQANKEALARGGAPVAVTFDQEAYRQKIEKDILTAFPELDNPAHLPNVRRLSLLYAQQELIDRELSLNPRGKTRESLLESLKNVELMSQNTMKVLGIHPDQLRKQITDKMQGTVADLVAMLEDDNEFRKREKLWSLTLALQLWWMSEHPNGDGTGPQVHPFEIWHMTRCKPFNFRCKCGREYRNLIDGFEPHELFEYLVQNGILVEEPVIPGFIKPEELKGINDYFRKGASGDGADGANGEGGKPDSGDSPGREGSR